METDRSRSTGISFRVGYSNFKCSNSTLPSTSEILSPEGSKALISDLRSMSRKIRVAAILALLTLGITAEIMPSCIAANNKAEMACITPKKSHSLLLTNLPPYQNDNAQMANCINSENPNTTPETMLSLRAFLAGPLSSSRYNSQKYRPKPSEVTVRTLSAASEAIRPASANCLSLSAANPVISFICSACESTIAGVIASTTKASFQHPTKEITIPLISVDIREIEVPSIDPAMPLTSGVSVAKEVVSAPTECSLTSKKPIS
mmetsp:Transcript_13835/g.23610  ORF Transcript_13835/g.23610 Transcript_13835/m.23610 type:complete len:262 (-) Transcript_13835:4177-4962(-)